MIAKKIYFIFLFSFSFFVLKAQQDIFDIARHGTVNELKALLKKDSLLINAVNQNGHTPLILACYKGNNEVAKYLIAQVQDINESGNEGTPLMAATIKNNQALVKLLIAKGANVNYTDANGVSALLYAVMFKSYDITKMLIAAKADKTLKDNRGNSALDYAKIHNDKKLLQLLKD